MSYGLFRLTKQLQNSAFIRHNAILFIGSMLIGLVNYAYYPVLSRLLNPNAFGEVQTLSSLFLQIAIFLNVLALLTVNIVANYDDTVRRNRMIVELERLAVLLGIIFLIAILVVGGVLKQFFHFDSVWPFIMLATAIVMSVPLTFRTGYLRGLKLFGLISQIGLIAAIADLILAAAFALVHWSTTGVMLALVIAQGATFGYAALCAHRHGFIESTHKQLWRLPDLGFILPELKYAGLVLVGSLVITAMYSLDIVVVKHYFNAHTAGLYAGISTVARIIFFLTASITQVLLPAVKLQQVPHENRQVLLKSLVLLGGIGGAALLVFAMLPRLIVRVLMGHAYLAYANLLPRLSMVVFLISLLNLFIMYHLALRHYLIAAVVIAGLGITLILVSLYHTSLLAIINSLLCGSLSMLAMLGVWAGVAKFKKQELTGGPL